MEPRRRAELISTILLGKYGEPEWREPLPPLDELISTILSQNTNDTNRDRAYNALRKKFPTWEEVRDAPQNEVIDAIRLAGLANQKGPRIQTALQQITQQRGRLELDFLKEMTVEEAREWLLGFKGVGPKTASIVLLFSLDKPAFPVDTHIYRVTGRLGLRPAHLNVDQAHGFLERVFNEDEYKSVHLNIIRLGREICHARRPNCPNCPLIDICDYGKQGKGDQKES